MRSRLKNPALVAGAITFALAAGNAVPASAQSTKTLQSTVDAMRAGGKTIAGPGTFSYDPGVAVSVGQFTTAANVCATVTIVSGTAVQLNLRDPGGSVQSVATSATVRTVAGCADGVIGVDLTCTGAVPCLAVWRVDAR